MGKEEIKEQRGAGMKSFLSFVSSEQTTSRLPGRCGGKLCVATGVKREGTDPLSLTEVSVDFLHRDTMFYAIQPKITNVEFGEIYEGSMCIGRYFSAGTNPLFVRDLIYIPEDYITLISYKR